jgi:polysaccharide biosynthesis/export protein
VKHISFSLFVICCVCSSAMSQVKPVNPQSQGILPVAGPVVPSSSKTPEDFVLGPEDVLLVSVWHEPDLSTKTVVRPDGKIGVPLLGDIQASDLTTEKLRDIIAEKLSRYMEQPEVSVVVVEIHSLVVHLIGGVARQGAYAMGGPLNVVELLARAGGLTEFTKGESITIVRTVDKGKEIQRIPFNYREYIEGRGMQRNIQLKSGDLVIVR